MFTKWLQDDRLEQLTFTGDLFPKAADREFWGNDPQWIAAAEEYVSYEWPCIKATDWLAFREQGNRVAQETPHFARRRALSILLFGELAEYRGRFLPDIANGLLAICEETFWGVSAHVAPPYFPAAEYRYIDLFAAETGALLATVRTVLRDELQAFCPEIVERVDHELRCRIVNPYREHTDFWWMNYDGGKVNNWNPWILSNVLTVYLLQVKDRAVMIEGLRKMFTEIERYYAAMPEDGGCDEGSLYWTRAGGKLFEFCDTLYRASAGQLDLFDDAKLREILLYETRVYIGDGWFVNFADGPAHPRGVRDMAWLLYAIGERLDEDNMRALGSELLRSSKETETDARLNNLSAALRSRLYGDAIRAYTKYQAPPSAVLPCLQNAFARKDGWYYALKGGCNDESHNHNDVGNLIVFYDNQPVLIDPGCGVYTKDTFNEATRYGIWTMRSLWHTLPCINGAEQPYGAAYAADAFSSDGACSTVSFATAYPENAGVTALQRRVTIDNGVAWEDVFAFADDSNEIIEYMQTLLPVRIDGERAVLGERFEITANMPCTVTVEEQSFVGDAHLNACWGQDRLYRIGFHFAVGNAAAIKLQARRL